jgi:nucleoside-diphosphate-sugar epimerase
VLRAARDAGARRVVLTSSFAAIGYTPVLDGVEPGPFGKPLPQFVATPDRALPVIAWYLVMHGTWPST